MERAQNSGSTMETPYPLWAAHFTPVFLLHKKYRAGLVITLRDILTWGPREQNL
jgi:hypothetical protein